MKKRTDDEEKMAMSMRKMTLGLSKEHPANYVSPVHWGAITASQPKRNNPESVHKMFSDYRPRTSAMIKTPRERAGKGKCSRGVLY